MIKVFIASMSPHLREARKIIANIIKSMKGFEVLLAEYGSVSRRKLISDADVVIIVFATKRGRKPRYTAKRIKAEFRWASAAKKDLLLFTLEGESRFNEPRFSGLLRKHSTKTFKSREELYLLLAEELSDWVDARTPVPTPPGNFEVKFSPDLTRHQVVACLQALADYYRACGGVGFDTDFEEAEVLVGEPTDALV
jgi:hypothetical protein